jgi:hypothetical protein
MNGSDEFGWLYNVINLIGSIPEPAALVTNTIKYRTQLGLFLTFLYKISTSKESFVWMKFLWTHFLTTCTVM